MKTIEQFVDKHSSVLSEDILKVDSILNHQVSYEFMQMVTEAFYEHFKKQTITKIITLETSGIAPSCLLAERLKVDLVIVKKQASKVLSNDCYKAKVHSFTKAMDYDIMIDKRFLKATDQVLIIDDFLANGQACLGLIELCNQAKAKVNGIGIVIEKSFQKGRSLLVKQGYIPYSLVQIDNLKNNKITFKDGEQNEENEI